MYIKGVFYLYYIKKIKKRAPPPALRERGGALKKGRRELELPPATKKKEGGAKRGWWSGSVLKFFYRARKTKFEHKCNQTRTPLRLWPLLVPPFLGTVKRQIGETRWYLGGAISIVARDIRALMGVVSMEAHALYYSGVYNLGTSQVGMGQGEKGKKERERV